MARLDTERQEKLEPKRMEIAIQSVMATGIIKCLFNITDKSFEFNFKGQPVKFFPYSGWHTGKSIKDGRGLQNLLKQLK